MWFQIQSLCHTKHVTPTPCVTAFHKLELPSILVLFLAVAWHRLMQGGDERREKGCYVGASSWEDKAMRGYSESQGGGGIQNKGTSLENSNLKEQMKRKDKFTRHRKKDTDRVIVILRHRSLMASAGLMDVCGFSFISIPHPSSYIPRMRLPGP